MSDPPDITPDNIVPLMEDPFIGYWNGHPIHRTAIAPEVVTQFREFAVDVWNAARYDMSLRYSELLLAVTIPVKNETRHETALRYITALNDEKREEIERHLSLAT
jgi:hypothetical protein